MLIRFLGTSAGELYPGLWCRCRNCQTARTGTAKDRRQSAALYIQPTARQASETGSESTPAVLIDFPSEIADQACRHQVDLTRLQHLLVTHSHGDHWFPYQLRWRHRPSQIMEDPPPITSAPRFTALPLLHIYGNSSVEAILHRELSTNLEPYDIAFHRVAAGDSFMAGVLKVTALRANHDVGKEEALHYVLQDASATLLYGLDGDTFLPETRAALKSFRFNVVVLESTFGYGDGGGHRNFARVEAEAQWLRAENLLAPGGRIVATHFSPHHCPPHTRTEAYLQGRDIIAAWDGLEVISG